MTRVGMLASGFALVLFGVLWLLNTMGIIRIDVVSVCLPILIIAAGVLLIGKAFDRKGWLDWF